MSNASQRQLKDPMQGMGPAQGVVLAILRDRKNREHAPTISHSVLSEKMAILAPELGRHGIDVSGLNGHTDVVIMNTLAACCNASLAQRSRSRDEVWDLHPAISLRARKVVEAIFGPDMIPTIDGCMERCFGTGDAASHQA